MRATWATAAGATAWAIAILAVRPSLDEALPLTGAFRHRPSGLGPGATRPSRDWTLADDGQAAAGGEAARTRLA